MLGMSLIPWGLALILVLIYSAGVLILVLLGRRTDARALAGFIPDCIRLVRRLLGHPSTSTMQRVALFALLLYLLSPVDLVPDFIPVAGVADDAILIALVLARLLSTHGEAEIREAWPGPESSLKVVLRIAGR